MRKSFTIGLVGVFIILGGCASYSSKTVNNDEQIDLYLSTLDDKHFVWCELDLTQCRQDYEKWKFTPRGRAILREYEKEATGQTYNTHQVPNVFRTHFVQGSQLAVEAGQNYAISGKPYPSIYQTEYLLQGGMPITSEIYGPELPSNFGTHSELQKSP